MVVFSCDGCGDMLKKSQVDLHAQRCRRCDSVSCVDCSVSFYGDDFRLHTSCISEAERYEKTAYRGNQNSGVKKKRNPQEAWMDLIVSVAKDAPVSIRQYVNQIASLDNVPRKEKQFRNFAGNSLKLRGNAGNSIVDSIWKYLCQQRENQQQIEKHETKEKDGVSKLEDTQASSEGVPENMNGIANGFNKETEHATATKQDENGSKLTPKLVKKAMKKVLKKAPTRSMKMKALRREVCEKLGAKGGSDLKLLKRFLKQQIDSDTDKIKLDGKVVSLR